MTSLALVAIQVRWPLIRLCSAYGDMEADAGADADAVRES